MSSGRLRRSTVHSAWRTESGRLPRRSRPGELIADGPGRMHRRIG